MTTRALPYIALLSWFATIGIVPAVASRTPAPPRAATSAAAQVPKNTSGQVPANTATESPRNAECLMCHGEADAKAEDGRSVVVDAARFSGSVHGTLGLECTSCHKDLVGVELPHPTKLAKVDCSTCHEAAVAKFNESIHATARRDGANTAAARCVDCHTSHDIRAASDPESTTYALKLPATCSRCHGNADVIKNGHIAIGNVGDLYKDSIHGRAISRSGLLVSANCTSCHGAHDIRKKDDAQSRVFRSRIPETCASCHEGIHAQFARGSHGNALAAGNARAPVCTDCHSAHAIQRADVGSWKLDTVKECGTCHLDKIRTYRDTFHGQVTSLGFVRVAKCSDCHGAHEVHPKSDPRSLVSPQRVLTTCQTCHTNATAGFAAYDPHADKDNRGRNPALYFGSRFMHWLLIGVFGFFGLHAALWLPRSAIQRFRKSQPPSPRPPESPAE